MTPKLYKEMSQDILSDREIKQAIALFKKVPSHKLNAALVAKLIEPNIDRINRNLNQDNDPKFLAYAVEWALMHMNIARKLGPRLTEADGFTLRGNGK